ncbi:MAG: efflux transporter periplasmic adaptor subunit, partial [Nitrospirota bacterium]
MKNKSIISILVILAIGAVLAFLILRTEKTSNGSESREEESGHAHEEAVKGPHRGRLLSRDNFQVEAA